MTNLYSRPDIGVVSSELVGSSVVAVARNPWVDGLRVAAAVGIVWFHVRAPEAEFAYSGLSVFLIMTFYFEGPMIWRGQPLRLGCALPDPVGVLVSFLRLCSSCSERAVPSELRRERFTAGDDLGGNEH